MEEAIARLFMLQGIKTNWKTRKFWGAIAIAMLGIAFFSPIFHVQAELRIPKEQYKAGKSYLEHGYSNVEAMQAWSNAAYWFRKAADQGYGPAEFEMGRCYSFGYCGKKDNAEITKWDRRSAEHGYWWGFDYLSNDYYLGLGVKQDYEEAFFWHVLAEDTKHRLGIVITGGVPRLSKLTQEQEEAIKRKAWQWKDAHPISLTDQPDPN